MVEAAPAPAHAAIKLLQYQENTLLWANRKVPDIASMVGRTPFYAYDKQLMSHRVSELRAALPEKLHVHYAMKANPMPELVDHMAKLVDCLDVAGDAQDLEG